MGNVVDRAMEFVDPEGVLVHWSTVGRESIDSGVPCRSLMRGRYGPQ
jgi:hypothetical protein